MGRTDAEAETPIFWPPHAKNWLPKKSPWCWEWLKAWGERDERGWDCQMASPTQWTWVWVKSGGWWWTGKSGVLQSMGSQRVGHEWVTELNWKEFNHVVMCFPKGGTRTLPQVCTIVSLLSLHCLCIPFLPCFGNVCFWSLELWEGNGGWSLFPTNKKQGHIQAFVPRSPIGSCSVSSLYSRMYRNMDIIIFSLFWLFPLHLFLVQSHIMCNICVIL